ncbi:4-hydroxybenzoate polyprenyltransferase [Rhodanobacter sp. ANJX3]|uniref:4-hydroxybenzoate octaprenyltransferase n=1 Tax=unclassified Rhodanobacter TaxID=2621553 RepID=UPI0015CD6676|nr:MULTISPECIES: 4-hydroxybenzoate octaprenyltransferase [unclassified Rhodanobacter]MBB5359461.1 4-hydroxybenzoate polyprenyltransferase [Rhodanobacter sp. ANJX3]NYE30187.1 4-hydroxybenzoate polyprenyltransferase [Rhodanobacter sp. K2T2]
MSPPPRKRQPRKAAPSSTPRTRPGAPRPIEKKPPRPADSSTRATRVLNWLLQKLPPRYREKALDYLVLTRMDRPIGALLLLWPTWWALWLAAGDFPPWKPLIVFTLGVFAMRAAGCAINDYADRKLDPQVARTAGRPIASGRVTPREALIVFVALLAFAFVLVLFTNALTIKLSFIGAALAAAYPFTKRYTHMPQVVLGAAFGWSIPMAFAAVAGAVPPVAWLLFIGNILWSVIYDTEYAMVDREDDIRAGAKSTAILFGDADLPILGILMGTFLLAMLFVGQRAALGWPYWVGLLIAAALFGYQLWLIRHRARDACLAAFRHNNWLGVTLWIGIVLALAVR